MKKIAYVLMSLLTVATLLSCKNETEKNAVEANTSTETISNATAQGQEMPLAKVEFTIEGMSCPMGCAKKIEGKLAEMDGVKSASVDFDKKLAMVEYEDGKVTTSSIEATVKSAGEAYRVTEMKTVESFTSNTAKHECSEACKKEGCTAEKKKACGDKCTKACCVKKA